VSILSETQNPSPSLDENGLGRIWQVIAAIAILVLAAVISVFEMISQARKYKKISIPIE
jgi:hypothetical protein